MKDSKLVLYNRNISKSIPLEKKGAKIFHTPKEIANNADFIIICVTNFEAVNNICFQKDGIQETENANVIIADFTYSFSKRIHLLL